MVFRLPSNLESFVPPPSEQHVAQTPWRGSIVVSGMRDSDRSSNQEIFVTAVETDGDKAQHWPTTFYARIVHERPVLREFQAWLKTCVPASPICTFMPNRLRQADHHAVNQAHFRSLSRILFDNQVIAVAPWANHTFPGAGIIIYPAQNSSAVLVGVPFFYSGFPEFLGIMPSLMTPTPPNMMQGSRPVQYQQRMMTSPTYESSPNRHASSVSPHNSDSSSPHEQTIPPYNYMMSRPASSGYPNLQVSPSHAGWPHVKAEDGHSYATYPTSNHLSYA